MTFASDLVTQSIPLSFEDFLAQYGDDDRYELIDGELFDLETTGPHEEVAAKNRAMAEFRNRYQQGLNYFVPHRCLIKPLAKGTGFRPDVIVLDQAALTDEPLWSSQRRRHHPG